MSFLSNSDFHERYRVLDTHEIRTGLELIRIYVKPSAGNQDLNTILILATNELGEQFYVQDLKWMKYVGFDMLDVSQTSFSGVTGIEVRNGIPAIHTTTKKVKQAND